MASLSLLLVVRNGRPFVDRAIALLCEFASTEAEVVVVDGHSTDGTWERLAQVEEGNWQVFRQADLDGGLAAGRNEAIERARGQFLAFLDVDDRWLPEKMERQSMFLRENAEVEVVGCHLRKVGRLIEDGSDALVPGWTPSACLFRRSAFDRLGAFDRRYRIACDHEWFLRAKRAGLPMGMLDECLVEKTLHESNLSQDRVAYRRELIQIQRRISLDG